MRGIAAVLAAEAVSQEYVEPRKANHAMATPSMGQKPNHRGHAHDDARRADLFVVLLEYFDLSAEDQAHGALPAHHPVRGITLVEHENLHDLCSG
jgi:hypothetical protein